MGFMGPWEWAIVAVLVLLVFGGKLLPKLGRSLGKSLTGLKQGAKEGTEEFKSAVSEDSDAGKNDASTKSKEGDDSK